MRACLCIVILGTLWLWTLLWMCRKVFTESDLISWLTLHHWEIKGAFHKVNSRIYKKIMTELRLIDKPFESLSKRQKKRLSEKRRVLKYIRWIITYLIS